ncbi:MAG: hypothetical protein LH624_02675 [Cryobacterium sp.]|nr:hypothetical protein [Cryobacterium sp.]
MTQEVVIKIGEQGPEFAKRYPESVRLVHQPAGLDFYKIDWDQRRPGVAHVENGQHSLVIHDVLGISTSQDLQQLRHEGLFDFTVFAGITQPDRISHDEARLKTYMLLQRILNAGWTQVIERSEPRLKGKARQDYMFATSNLNGLDATYVPTFEEWMRIESRTPWSFYANGLYMDVNFTRERTLTDPAKPGSYLLTFNIRTETEYFRGFAGPDNRLRWRELLPQELAKVADLRAKKEAELRAKGVIIDESYRDPRVPTLK